MPAPRILVTVRSGWSARGSCACCSSAEPRSSRRTSSASAPRLRPRGPRSVRDAGLDQREGMRSTLAEFRPDVVIPLAAVMPRYAEERPHLAFEVNAGATAALLEESRRRGVSRFVFASSNGVYGVVPADGTDIPSTSRSTRRARAFPPPSTTIRSSSARGSGAPTGRRADPSSWRCGSRPSTGPASSRGTRSTTSAAGSCAPSRSWRGSSGRTSGLTWPVRPSGRDRVRPAPRSQPAPSRAAARPAPRRTRRRSAPAGPRCRSRRGRGPGRRARPSPPPRGRARSRRR